MNELVNMSNGELTTTSKIVADVFNKPHRNILVDIRKLECSEEFSQQNFVLSDYKTNRGKTYKCYSITRDGFAFLCMGFTGKKAAVWKEKYINAFNQMERGLLNLDQRMNTLSVEIKENKSSGTKWGELGREINRRKKQLEAASNDLLSEVQLTLDYNS